MYFPEERGGESPSSSLSSLYCCSVLTALRAKTTGTGLYTWEGKAWHCPSAVTTGAGMGRGTQHLRGFLLVAFYLDLRNKLLMLRVWEKKRQLETPGKAKNCTRM